MNSCSAPNALANRATVTGRPRASGGAFLAQSRGESRFCADLAASLVPPFVSVAQSAHRRRERVASCRPPTGSAGGRQRTEERSSTSASASSGFETPTRRGTFQGTSGPLIPGRPSQQRRLVPRPLIQSNLMRGWCGAGVFALALCACGDDGVGIVWGRPAAAPIADAAADNRTKTNHTFEKSASQPCSNLFSRSRHLQ